MCGSRDSVVLWSAGLKSRGVWNEKGLRMGLWTLEPLARIPEIRNVCAERTVQLPKSDDAVLGALVTNEQRRRDEDRAEVALQLSCTLLFDSASSRSLYEHRKWATDRLRAVDQG